MSLSTIGGEYMLIQGSNQGYPKATGNQGKSGQIEDKSGKTHESFPFKFNDESKICAVFMERISLEQTTHNPLVNGSSPCGPTIKTTAYEKS
jgi:hypothetical protein